MLLNYHFFNTFAATNKFLTQEYAQYAAKTATTTSTE